MPMVADWLGRFEAAVASGGAERLAPLFLDDSHWHDILAPTWRIVTASGRGAIAGDLARPTRERALLS